MNDPQMNDILARLNAVGAKPADPNNKSGSAGDPAMHEILSRFHAVSGKYQVNEGLGAEQRKVGQLGPTDKPSKRKDHAFKGKLVGEDYNVDEYDQEGEMAKGQLDRAADAAQELHDILDDADNLPEWVQSKITKALDYLDTARDYIKSEFNEDVEDGIDTLTMGIPLFIRMLEYAREEAQTDADLHHVTKKMMDMGGNVTMDDYDEIMSSVGGKDAEMDEAAGGALDDTLYGSATATVTPTVGGYRQTRDLDSGSYTDHFANGPLSTQTTYNKSGQMTSQHAQYKAGDQSMAKSRFYPKKKVGEAEYHTTVGSMMDKGQAGWNMDALSDADIDKYADQLNTKDQLQKDYGDNWRDKVRQGVRDIKIGGSVDDYGSNASASGYVDIGGARVDVGVDGIKADKNFTDNMTGAEWSVNGKKFKVPKFDKNTTQQQAADYATQQVKKLFQDQYSDMRRLAGQDWTGPGRGSIEKAIDSATTADQLEKHGSLSGGVSGETHRSAGADNEIANLRKLAGQQAPGYSTDELAKIGQQRLRDQEKNLFQDIYSEDYVGGREAPQDLVKSLSKSYKDFVKEVEQQNAAQPDRELRSKKEKPRKFGNILGEE